MPPTQHLRPPDLAIIVVYLVAITLFGLRFRSRGPAADRSLKSYFLAGNTIPWWAIALSVVSAETSTLTIISIPGVAFAGNFGFLQVVLGYLVGRVVVAALLLPRYFAGEMLTAYQLIDRRFGPVLHKVTAGLFLLTRAAAEGVRVFAVSIVVGITIGTGDILSIGIITALTLLYTFEGGLAAVIWTDVAQMAIYVLGTLVALFSLGHHVLGGWSTIAHAAGTAGKFHTFNFAFNLTQPYTFWAGLLGGTFLTMASHGTDQLMVQRLLAARNLGESRLALLSSGVVIFAQFTFFLLIGAGLWVFYGMATPAGAPHLASEMWARTTSPDRLFPTFITTQMPTGTAGLLVAAILAAAMSNLSAALNSLSSTTVVDFYIRARPRATDRERTLIAKSSTLLWALVLFAVAIVSLHAGGKGHVVEIGLSIASVAYGCLLGVFLLGTLTRFATEYGTITGMICGFTLNLWLWQGTFPVHLGPLTLPKVAFTWYVLIGSAATFAIGSLASLVLRKSSIPKLNPVGATALLFSLLSLSQGTPCLHAQVTTLPPPAQTSSPAPAQQAPSTGTNSPAHQRTSPPTPDPTALAPRPLKIDPQAPANFSQVSQLLTDAIAHHQLPGAVVVVGHAGEIVFHHAYGNRKLAGEPGLDGQPSPAEPMTEDTIFDMASLTKVIVTATAIGQLHDEGRVDFDAPLEQYLPAFNPTHDPERAKVTLRLLLTHFSGEPPDVNLKDPWGLATPDKAEGLHRALTTPLAGTPGTRMVYSDINFILLGALVEKITAFPLDLYANALIFQPLEMTSTRYLPFDQACGADTLGSAITGSHEVRSCPPNSWNVVATSQLTAPTAHDDDGTPATNPDFNHLLRGTVHDPTTRRMGGVAGHAGVFSTAHDMTLFAQALLDLYAGRPSTFPLKRPTLIEMTVPQQPGHTPLQAGQHFRANRAAEAQQSKTPGAPPSRPASSGAKVGPQDAQSTTSNLLLAPNYPAIKDQPLRGYGWDIDSGYSKPRGRILPIGSFGHTGFTGTSLWLDPNSDTFILLLANAIHPKAGTPISNLRGEVATAAALALGLYPSQTASSRPEAKGRSGETPVSSPQPNTASSRPETKGRSGDTPGFSPQPNTASSRPQLTCAGEVKTPAVWVATAAPDPDRQVPPKTSCVFVRGCRSDTLQTAASPSHQLLPAHFISKRVLQAPALESALSLSKDPAAFETQLLAAPSRLPGAPKAQPINSSSTQTGLDTLEATHFAALTPFHHLALLTNQTGLDAHGRRTIDILFTDLPKTLPQARLTTLFSPEHGIFGQQDTEHPTTETDPSTGLHVTTLYGTHDSDRRPSHAQLLDLDAVVIDLQDAGLRCYTYETVLGYFLEAAAAERTQSHHDLAIIVLDRPNPLGGLTIAGPTSDPGSESYINYLPIPLQHGLTLGELARYINVTKHLDANLTVIRLQHWHRDQFFDETGLPWTPPSPNLHTLTANTIYPATSMLELTNLSVGRGTPIAFEVFGAGTTSTSREPWFNAQTVADTLNARHIPGVTFQPIQLPVPEDTNHYPGHGQTIPAVHILLTTPEARIILNAPELGAELLSTLHRLYPTHFQLERSSRLVASRATLAAIARGDDPRTIAATWQAGLDRFRQERQSSLLY